VENREIQDRELNSRVALYRIKWILRLNRKVLHSAGISGLALVGQGQHQIIRKIGEGLQFAFAVQINGILDMGAAWRTMKNKLTISIRELP
jgi:hypothetical protein